MESRMVKFYSKESNMVAIHAIPGHFATSHSHINYYIDITSLKTRIREAKEDCPRAVSEDRQSSLCGYDRMYGRYGSDRCIFSGRV